MRYAIIIVLLLGIVAAFVVTYRPGGSRQIVILPTGLEVEYLGASVGGATFSTEKGWHQIARRALPASMRTWLPSVQSGSCSRGTNSVTLFFKVTDPTGTRINGTPWQHFQATDDAGFQYNPDGGYCSFGATTNTALFGLTLEAFPRRQASFDFAQLGPNRTVLAKFRVPNPIPGPFQEWQPEPLPQRQTNGPVVLTLESLRLRAGDGWSHVDPKFRIESTNALWAQSKAERMTVLDATGNEGTMLSPREPAWKIRALVHRQREQDFSGEDRLVITNVAIPKAGTFVEPDRSAERNGVALKMIAVAGPGKLVVSNRTHLAMPAVSSPQSGYSSSESGTDSIETWANGQHFILFQAANPQPDDEIRFFVTDNEGRTVKFQDTGYYSKTGLRQYLRAFTPETNATHLNITVALSRPWKFEFTVDPKAIHSQRKDPP